MDMSQMPDISLGHSDANAIAQALGDSFRTYGFAKVIDHGIDPHLSKEAWRLSKELFARTTEEKRRWYDAGIAGQRGYTPFKT